MKLAFFTATATTALLSAMASAAPVASPQSGIVIPTVRVQLNWGFNNNSKADVPLNNSAFPIQGNFANDEFNSGFIDSVPAGISDTVIACQGYTDEAGTIKVGNRFRGNDIVLFGLGGENKPVGSLRCGFDFS